MNKLLLLFSSIGFLSCQPKDQLPSDAAARASGAYAVQLYVVDGDTLYSTNSNKNKLGISNFYIGVSRKTADTVMISYAENLSTTAIANLTNMPLGVSRLARVDETNGKFIIVGGDNRAPLAYESSIDGIRFYERTVGFNVDSLEARWRLDSLKSPYKPPLKEVIITAQK